MGFGTRLKSSLRGERPSKHSSSAPQTRQGTFNSTVSAKQRNLTPPGAFPNDSEYALDAKNDALPLNTATKEAAINEEWEKSDPSRADSKLKKNPNRHGRTDSGVDFDKKQQLGSQETSPTSAHDDYDAATVTGPNTTSATANGATTHQQPYWGSINGKDKDLPQRPPKVEHTPHQDPEGVNGTTFLPTFRGGDSAQSGATSAFTNGTGAVLNGNHEAKTPTVLTSPIPTRPGVGGAVAGIGMGGDSYHGGLDHRGLGLAGAQEERDMGWETNGARAGHVQNGANPIAAAAQREAQRHHEADMADYGYAGAPAVNGYAAPMTNGYTNGATNGNINGYSKQPLQHSTSVRRANTNGTVMNGAHRPVSPMTPPANSPYGAGERTWTEHYGPGHRGAKVLHTCSHCGMDEDISRYFKGDSVYRLAQ